MRTGRDSTSTVHRSRCNLVEYALDGALLGIFMIAACAFCVILEHAGSPVRVAIESAFLRRALMGLAMGLTAVALIESAWGRRSGAHMNPAVTLAFLRLGKVRGVDATGLVIAQFVGASLGVAVARLALGSTIAAAEVSFVVTRPGSSIGAAFAGEVAISFLMMSAVLAASSSPRLAPMTPWIAGALVACWITVEAPLSGMSMNPARTFGSALHAGVWTSAWIYFTAPPLGMLLAAELRARSSVRARAACAKLRHCARSRCIFCGHEPDRRRAAPPDHALKRARAGRAVHEHCPTDP